MREAEMNSRIRVLNASPGSFAFDILLDKSPAIAQVAYGQLSDYVTLSPERHQVRILPAGVHWPESEILDDHLAKLRPGYDYTLIAVGEMEDLQLVLLEDITQVPGLDRAKVRFFHASPDAPAVDVGMTGEPALFRQVPFTQATPIVEVETGTVDLEVRRAGHPDVTIATLPEYTLVAERLYTFVALGLLDGQPPFTIKPIVVPVRRCVPAG